MSETTPTPAATIVAAAILLMLVAARMTFFLVTAAAVHTLVPSFPAWVLYLCAAVVSLPSIRGNESR